MKIEKSVNLIRIFLGVNFFWFGMLKFFPGVSPAEALATMTINVLTFGLIAPALSIKLLAIWEVMIGIGFLSGRFIPFFVRIFMVHMVLTFTPLFFFPDICFTEPPFALTLVGQYIIKNLVFIASGIAVCIVHKEKQL
jgi:uncharacterized membrane protein YkgB